MVKKVEKKVKKTANYTITQKRSGRYSVTSSDAKMINGEEKVKILVEAGLIKIKVKKEAPAEAAAEPAAS